MLLPCCSRVAPVLLPCCSRVAPVLLPSLPVLVFMSIEFSEYLGPDRSLGGVGGGGWGGWGGWGWVGVGWVGVGGVGGVGGGRGKSHISGAFVQNLPDCSQCRSQCCSHVAPMLLPCCSRVAPALLPCCSRPSRFLFRVLQWSLVTICYVLNVFVSFLGFRCIFLVFYCFCDFLAEEGDKATNLAAKPCFLHSELTLKPMVRVLAAWQLSF